MFHFDFGLMFTILCHVAFSPLSIATAVEESESMRAVTNLFWFCWFCTMTTICVYIQTMGTALGREEFCNYRSGYIERCNFKG